MISKELSQKLKIASLIATVFVVFRHAVNLQAFGVSGVAAFVENGCSFMTDVAVPFFFLCSGFFFFRYNYYEPNAYVGMLKKKAKSLLIPFVIWNILGALFLIICNKGDDLGNTPNDWVINMLMSAGYGPLWYVRDIMIYMALFPLYGWLVSKRWFLALIVLMLTIPCWKWNPGWTTLMTGEGAMFFLIGGMISLRPAILEYKMNVWVSVVLVTLWLLCSFFVTTWDLLIHKASILLGLIAFWNGLDLLPEGIKKRCEEYARFSFLIYVLHLYSLKAIKVCVAHYFGGNDVAASVTFMIEPVVVIMLIMGIGKLWMKIHPKSYDICIGGRS